MSEGLEIYIIGSVIAFVIYVLILREKDKTIELNELAIAIVFALCSWISVIALWVGWNIKKK